MKRWMKGSLLFALAFMLVACRNNATDPRAEPDIAVEDSISLEESIMESSESEEAEVVEIDGVEVGPLFRRYMEQMSEGSYFMKYRIEAEVGEEELGEIESSFAIDDGVVATETHSDMGRQNLVMKDDLIYMIVHEEQLVYVMDVSTDEEVADGVEEPIDMEGFSFVDSGTENGMDYEVYQYEDITYTYYFTNGNLVRMVLESPDFRSDMEVVEFSNDPPSDMFEIPADYEMMNFNEVLEGLDGMMDGDSMDGSE